ncbi:MAG: ectonucleotide pyrophosphatase/phosphodiesterase [Acidobacteriota bacterium]
MKAPRLLGAAIALSAVLLSSCSSVAAPETSTSRGRETVILVSLDGFRWDYPELHDAPTIRALAGRGVRAEGLVPVFPTKTFPNHYSIVTGLYTESHGIVGNNMWDPEWKARFSLGQREEVENARWWEGEPIWVTAERQGVTAATYFWPGSEAPIGGVRPTYWKKFDDAVPGNDRIDEVLAWLDLEGDERPHLVTLYFSDVDSAGHRYGPEAPETGEAVKRVDGYLARLVRGLEARGLLDETHLILTSDHGMAAMDPERVIVLEDYISVDDVQIVDLSVIAMLVPREGKEDAVYSALRNAHPELTVVRREDVPDRLHYRDHRRITPLVGWSSPGWYIYPTHFQRDALKSRFSLGQHGFDNAARDMRGLFVAAGPRLRSGLRHGLFQSVDVYGLIAEILDLEPAPNDGDRNAATDLLISEVSR